MRSFESLSDREILALYLEEFTLAEIASILKMPIGTIGRRRHEAVRKILAFMNGDKALGSDAHGKLERRYA